MKHALLSREVDSEAFEDRFTATRCKILKGVMGNSNGGQRVSGRWCGVRGKAVDRTH